MNTKLIALDLDDTTLSRNGTLSELNSNAIKAAVENGIEVIVASGRNFASLPQSVTNISGIRFAIVSNGAAIYDIEEGKRISSYCLTSDAVIKIFKEAPKTGLHCYEVIIDGTAYCESRYFNDPLKHGPAGVSIHIADYIRRTRTPVDDITSFALKNAGRLDCINIVCQSAAACKELHSHLEAFVPDIYLTSSVPHLLEISHCMAGKGNGLRFICDYLGIHLSSTAACGNADNDADMLKAAGTGAAVLNASQKCLDAADIIIGANTDNGVGRFIMELIHSPKAQSL